MPREVVRRSAVPGGSAERLFDGLARRYDVLAETLSFGQNRRWRRAMVQRVVDESPLAVLDVATGTCAVALELAQRTDAWIGAIDLTETMLARGRANVILAHEGARIALVLGSAENLPFAETSFDALTFTYLMRYVDEPDLTLRELVRVVKPGGIIAALEFSVPDRGPWRLGWWLYTRTVLPIVGGLVGGRAWFRVGRFLGSSISDYHRRYPPDRLVDVWRRAGIVDIVVRRMSLGGALVISGIKADG